MAASKSPNPDAAAAGSPTLDPPAKSPDNTVAPSTPDEAAKPAKPGRAARPNTDAFKADLAAKEKEHEEVMKKFKDIKVKMDLTMPRSKDGSSPSPAQTRRQELLGELREIRDKQAGGKNARVSQQDQITRLNDQVKSRIAEQKVQRSKLTFKTVDEVDGRIADLDAQVNGGMMKLVDEKKALVEISNLRKTKKMFAQFEDGEKQINDLKTQVKKLKEEGDNPEQKALSDRYSQVQAELDELKKQQDDVNSNRTTLRAEYNQLRDRQQELWVGIKTLKDDFYARDRAWKAQRDHDRKAEQERYQMDRKLERAKKMLEEASDPAFLEEIRRANSLLFFFDPASKDAAQSQKSPLLPLSGMAAQAQRKVDDSAMKGMRLISKQDRDDEYLPAKAKGKKGKKHHGNNPEVAKTFNCPPSVMEDCSFLKIEPPMSAADVPGAVEQIKAKLDRWKADQAEQTSKNVEKAKKEIERLEAEEAKVGGGDANGAQGKNGTAAVAETTEAIKDVSLEDKTVEVKSEEPKPEAEAVAA